MQGYLVAVKDATYRLAESLDSLRSRHRTLVDVTIPARETEVEHNQFDYDPEGSNFWAAFYAERDLQREADAIVADWVTAQETFSSTVNALQQVTTEAHAYFDYGSTATSVGRANQLFHATQHSATPRFLEDFYEHLATMTPEEIAAFALAHPDVRITPPPLPDSQQDLEEWPGGAEGAQWWNGLSAGQRTALVTHLPAWVGNTEGVPYSDRDQANRNALTLALNQPGASDKDRASWLQIRDSLALPNPDAADRFLVSFLPFGDDGPLAAVSVGNPDTASSITPMVSGMGSGTHNMVSEVDHAQRMQENMGPDHAFISWIGYDSPNMPLSPEVMQDRWAVSGSYALAHHLDGLYETRASGGSVPSISPMAHSYGTNTLATALTRTEHPVDNAILYASAGLDGDFVSHASDMNVQTDQSGRPQVWVTLADGDPWAPKGAMFREKPHLEDFGAMVFSSDGEGNVPGDPVSAHEQTYGSPEDQNWGYLNEESQAFQSMLLILGGEGESIDLLYSD